MTRYRRVTKMDRLSIFQGIQAGLSQNMIAAKLGFHPSTVSREIKRNSCDIANGKKFKYFPEIAEMNSISKLIYRKRSRKFSSDLKIKVNGLIEKKWSPEQISHRLKLENQYHISHETIYHHIYEEKKRGGGLWKHLRYSHKMRKNRCPRKDRRGRFNKGLSIENRSEACNKRLEIGHWERDTMVGLINKKTTILAILDRKSRYTLLGKLEKYSADYTTEETIKLLGNLPLKSITNDRGKEFSDFKGLMEKINCPVYFCHPQCPHERGSNENRIGLIRQYIPKGEDINYKSLKEIKEIEENLNHRPMKCLNWKTPHEVFYNEDIRLVS